MSSFVLTPTPQWLYPALPRKRTRMLNLKPAILKTAAFEIQLPGLILVLVVIDSGLRTLKDARWSRLVCKGLGRFLVIIKF